MTRWKQKHHIESLLALLLFGLFAVCILAVLLTGGQAYRRLAARDDAAYDRRTAVQYLATRVRQADVLDSVSVADFDGCDALVLTEEIEGAPYTTRIYCYDGYLRELFAPADAEMTPADGEKILEAEALTVERSEDLLTITVDTETIYLHLRAGEGDAA